MAPFFLDLIACYGILFDPYILFFYLFAKIYIKNADLQRLFTALQTGIFYRGHIPGERPASGMQRQHGSGG